MTQVNGMSAVSGTPTRPTDHGAPQVTELRPRPAFPGPTARRPLVARFDRGAYDASYDRFLFAADRAFGDDLPRGAA